MKIVIQCAARKHPDAKTFLAPGRGRVAFVARPDLAPRDKRAIHARPDDPSDDGRSWRKRLLDPADEILDGPFLLSGARPTQLGREAVVQGDLAKYRVPHDEPTLSRDHDRLGIVPDRDQRHAAEGARAGPT